ncbi:MAG: site-specific integrase, partial [Acidimicrobiales bacterium]
AWVGQMSADGLALATIEGLVRLFTSIMVAAVSDRLIARSPVAGVRLPRAEKSHHSLVPLTAEDVHAIADRVAGRFRALVLTAAGLGLRQGEACGLTVDRVDFLRRTVRIDRQLVWANGAATFGPPKTPASVRTLPLADEVGAELASHLQQYPTKNEAGLIFSLKTARPLSRQRVSEMMRAARRPKETFTFHDLRHFTASALIASGCSVKAVQAFLGHATASETLDTYGHLWPSDDDAIRVAIGRVLSPAESWLSHEDIETAH